MEEYRKCRRARMHERCQRRINEERKIGKQKVQKSTEKGKDERRKKTKTSAVKIVLNMKTSLWMLMQQPCAAQSCSLNRSLQVTACAEATRDKTVG
jgi:hypothetical protein